MRFMAARMALLLRGGKYKASGSVLHKFLKGKKSEIKTYPRVQMEVRDRAFEGVFRNETEWPITRTKYTKACIDVSSGKLVDELPTKLAVARYESEAQDNCVHFYREFTKDTELT